MSLSKHSFGRYHLIDRELCRKDYVKTRELKEIIEEELCILVSERQIQEDIKAMREDSLLGYFAPIEYDKSLKAYLYADRSYTIRAFGLRDDDLNSLMFYAKVFNQYKEYDEFRHFTGAIEKVVDAVTIRKGIKHRDKARTVVQTEYTPRLTGSELIPVIMQALDSDKVIEFQYQKFNDNESKPKKLHPHLLKEDRHRWYIIGKVEGHDEPTTTFALDRMKNVMILEEKFTPVDFDFDLYFAPSFGITVYNEEALEVVLSFTPKQGKYLKTMKIHQSQQTLVDDENEYRVSLTVIPSWEFYEKILGCGNSVTILSPNKVIQDYLKIIKLITALYS